MSILPAARKQSCLRVPIEVWHDIFEFATSVPRKYEFTMDGAAYVMANEASREETGMPTSKEVVEITRFRFSIIKVCKHLYAMGIKALWSHLRIDVRTEPIRVIEGIQEAISHDTTLTSSVIRLTLEESKMRPVVPGDLDEPLQRLTSQLTSLKIFVCPSKYACGMAKASLDVVVWNRYIHPKVFRQVLEQTTYIQNTRVLDISFRTDHQAHFGWNPILFPRLESLYIQIYSEQTIEHLTRSWEIPNLRILSIKGVSATYWLNFIEKWSTNIDILELSNSKTEWPRPIQLPNMKELRIEESLWMSYRISAPKLVRFCLLSFDTLNRPTRDNIIRAVNHARASFPALCRLQFRGPEGDEYDKVPFDYSLTSPEIRSWRKAGLKVDVFLSQSRKGIKVPM
jgi:hypothetical protein